LRCLCARAAAPESAEESLHPLSHLDVAQRQGRRIPRPARGHQSQDRCSREEVRLLRPRRLQPQRLDRGGAHLSRRGRSRGGARRARALWLLDAVARRARPNGRMALSRDYAVCQKPVIDALLDLLHKRLDYLQRDGEAFFNAEQNARIVTAAEQYYRVMYYG